MAFLDAFRASVREIESRITSTDVNTLDALADEVKVLEFSISDQVGEVPSSSIELVRAELSNLMKQLRDHRELLCPVKKFKFKRKAATDTRPAEPTPARSSTTPPSTHAATSSTAYCVDEKVLVFTESTIQSATAGSDVHLKDAVDATFVFNDDIGALHVSNLRNCVVVLCNAKVHGAVLVANCENVVCHVRVGQLRLFQCVNMCFYLDIMSTPIIEQSSRIWVAPLYGSEEKTEWAKVDDFNWLHRDASPNWKILPLASRRKPVLGDDENKIAEIEENAALWS
eukprot:GEMP01029978.1.p1 GENE.GEMP01029978.1~~GEMP01029978.1.p1  ORF type:complete len:284 (+),score=77.93 GEMP01029978.1:167-1018(+)